MQQAIAVLDSGVGGLTVAGEIMRQLPWEQILYFGDTARAPYGPRTPSEVQRYTLQIVDYLMDYHPKMVVLACNTATAAALDIVRSAVPIPVVGVIEPGARAAVHNSRKGFVGVIGTEGTIRSGAYVKALKELSPDVRVADLACPGFVPLVEQGNYATDEARRTVRSTLEPLASKNLDCLILGCTHYPFLSEYIAEAVGPGVRLINSADETAREICSFLYVNGIANESFLKQEDCFFCSGDAELFRSIAERWLGRPIRVTQVAMDGLSQQV